MQSSVKTNIQLYEMVGLMYEMVGGRMIQQKIYYGRNYFIRLSDYSLLFRLANRTFAYGYSIISIGV